MSKRIKDVRTSKEIKYGFGQNGNAILTNGETHTTDGVTNIVAITFITATTFTSLTPLTSEFMTNPTQTFPAGLTIYGNFTEAVVATGDILIYFG
jgi:hypothetical protein